MKKKLFFPENPWWGTAPSGPIDVPPLNITILYVRYARKPESHNACFGTEYEERMKILVSKTKIIEITQHESTLTKSRYVNGSFSSPESFSSKLFAMLNTLSLLQPCSPKTSVIKLSK